MFRKLLSNLPFNPSLITQVSFYAKRLNKEASIRRLGLVFVSLTVAVQAFAVISPAEASNQCSSNDVIRCGFRTRSEAVQRCNANTAGFRSIVEHFGVSCATIANAATETVNSRAYDNKLYSMGRNPYSKPGEFAFNIPSAGTFYFRPLSSWGNVNYKMLSMKTPDGAPFRIMYDCGNIVVERDYRPPSKPEPPSKITLKKVNSPTTAVKPGDTITYTIAFANTGGTSAYFTVNDRLSPELEFVDAQYGDWIFKRTGQTMSWNNNTPPYYTFGNTDAFGTPGFIKVKARVKANVASGRSVCNTAWATDVNPTTKKVQNWGDSTVCNKVVVECPEGTVPQPDGSCKTPSPEVKEPILTIEKKAKNLTQNIEDANDTTAKPGDEIEYALVTNNYGEGEAKDIILKPEELADILEYANLDLNSLDGAVFDNDTQSLAWDKPVTIKPSESITKTFRVKVKDPLPQTPSPSGNPGSYDLVMTNVYGNTINIKLPGGVVKNTEQVSQTLPNTGPGEALAIGGTLAVVSGYFFARSRLMAKELALVKQEYTSGN
jgi:uncharacterized repeat protein (TIGR01451 family)